MFQSNKCNLENLSQIVWHLIAGRCQSRKNRERGSVSLFRARPSGLFWPMFQRSNVWLSYHNYFSRTNLFIEISMSIGTVWACIQNRLKWPRDVLCLLRQDKNNYCFHNSKEQKVKSGVLKIWVKRRKGLYKSKYKCMFMCEREWQKELDGCEKLNLLCILTTPLFFLDIVIVVG